MYNVSFSFLKFQKDTHAHTYMSHFFFDYEASAMNFVRFILRYFEFFY